MGDILYKAFDLLKKLSVEDQERIAWELIERVEDKAEWDTIVAKPLSRKWLETSANAALQTYGKSQKGLSMSFLSLPQDNMLRGESYWSQFDELPTKVRQLAEKNYRLWKANSRHPGLRFKQIHPTLPIFSFRVGMQHRSVGVETDDGKMVWFWIGSFEHFARQTAS